MIVEKFIFYLYFICLCKLFKFLMKKNWIFNFKKWCYILCWVFEYDNMIRRCGSVSICICYVFCSNLKRMFWFGKINWIVLTFCLMFGLTYRGDGFIWRVYLSGASILRFCFLSRFFVFRGKLLSIKWFIYDFIL